ncbi:hypothetical protein [Mucilaginibacter rivuli]|nr:hypothetical protein [Mucilaginibacter rivuli]
MKIKPDKIEKNPYAHLTLLQKNSRRMAIAAAFAGVAIWFIKIVF